MTLKLEEEWCVLIATVNMYFVRAVLKIGLLTTIHVPIVCMFSRITGHHWRVDKTIKVACMTSIINTFWLYFRLKDYFSFLKMLIWAIFFLFLINYDLWRNNVLADLIQVCIDRVGIVCGLEPSVSQNNIYFVKDSWTCSFLIGNYWHSPFYVLI